MRSSALDLPAARQLRSDLRLQGWYEVGWLRPLAGFLVVFGSWLGLFACGLWVEHWGVRAVLVVPLTMSSGFLFTLAHDAGHGSFSASRKLNGVVGRLALVPSLHVFGLWRMHHDLHHRYTNLRQRDPSAAWSR